MVSVPRVLQRRDREGCVIARIGPYAMRAKPAGGSDRPRMTDPSREPGREADRRGRQAPAVPEGAITGPPDFIGVGVHKAGTTWWWALLVGHPAIDGVPRRKELHLLDRMREDPITQEQKDWYHRQFPRLPGHLAGEWTPRYQALPRMPEVIREVAPEAKLLSIVREPVERYRSGLNQWHEENRRRSLKRDEKSGKREARMRGFYGRQLERLMEVVGHEHVLVLQYERCVRQPAEEFARTLEFLDLEPFRPDPRLLRTRVNQTVGSKRTVPSKDEQALIEAYEPEVALLKYLVPDLDLALWPRFAHLDR
jgi:hypothetical protein